MDEDREVPERRAGFEGEVGHGEGPPRDGEAAAAAAGGEEVGGGRGRSPLHGTSPSGFLPPEAKREAVRETLARARSLVAQLARAFPGLGEDRAEEALHDAVLDWWRSERPAPPPLGWLYGAGWRNARNVMKSEATLAERERRWGNERVLAGVASLEDELEARWRLEHLERVVVRIERALVDDPMRVVFRLWIEGVRAADVYARALEIDALPTGECGSRVRRERTRLAKYLRRNERVRRIAARLRAE